MISQFESDKTLSLTSGLLEKVRVKRILELLLIVHLTENLHTGGVIQTAAGVAGLGPVPLPPPVAALLLPALDGDGFGGGARSRTAPPPQLRAGAGGGRGETQDIHYRLRHSLFSLQ